MQQQPENNRVWRGAIYCGDTVEGILRKEDSSSSSFSPSIPNRVEELHERRRDAERNSKKKKKKKRREKGKEKKKKTRTLSSLCTKGLFTAGYCFCRWNKEASYWRASHSKSRNRLRVKGAPFKPDAANGKRKSLSSLDRPVILSGQPFKWTDRRLKPRASCFSP